MVIARNWDKKANEKRPSLPTTFFPLLLYEVGRFVKMALAHIYVVLLLLSKRSCDLGGGGREEEAWHTGVRHFRDRRITTTVYARL